MEIRELNIKGFGKFHNKTMKLSSGINIVSGENEAGKTTTYHFLKSMLFGLKKDPDQEDNDIFTRYMPWDKPTEYGGSLKMEVDGKLYKITRKFQEDGDKNIFVCETTGENLSVEKGDLTGMLGGITENSYQNTMSIGQLSVETDENLAIALKNYAANYCGAGSSSINVINAYKKLTERYQNCNDEIRQIKKEQKDKIEQVIEKIDYLNEKQKNNIRDIKEQKTEIMDMAEQKKEKNLKCSELDKRRNELLDRKEVLWADLTKAREDEVRIEERIIRSQDKHTFRSREYEDAMKSWTRAGILQRVIDAVLILIGAIGVGAGLYFYMIGSVELGFAAVLGVIGFICLVFGAFKVLKWNNNNKPGEPEIDAEEMGKLEAIQDMIAGKRKTASEELEYLSLEIEKNDSELNMLHGELESIDDRSNVIYGKIGSMEEQLSEIKAEISDLQEEQEMFGKVSGREVELVELRDAISMAKQRLEVLAEQFREQFSVDLQRRASEILSEVTKGKYTSLMIDDSLNMNLNTGKKVISVDKVSRGTMDQIYFALRMAVMDVMYGDELPVVMDDALAFYDDRRMAEALIWLAQNKKQVIIFTCHQREEEFLRENRINYTRCIVPQ